MSTLTVDDPFTGEPACAVNLADADHVSQTLDHAKAASVSFRDSTLAQRIALIEGAVSAMEADSDRIALDISRMMGKPLSQAQGEIRGMAGRARTVCKLAESALADIVPEKLDGFERRIVKEPLGVVFDLPAWNYPLLTAINVVAPAILAGNSVIVKHSPRSPLCGVHFAEAFVKAGAPKNLVQALHCDHATSEAIVGDSRVDHVVFTGSVYGGHRIQDAASKRFINVGLELGGNDAAYVAPDCDLANTVENIVDGCIYNAGQSCCAVERVYVHADVYDRFLERAEALVRAYVIGDPRDPKTTLGPIAQPGHIGELEVMVADARSHGGLLLAGGNKGTVDGRGRFFEATLLAHVPQEALLMRGESFGPIVAVQKVSSDEEALRKMNDSRLGLTASIWTADRERAAKMAAKLEVGTVYMNRCDSVDPSLTWSGVKDSGRGHSLSVLGFDQLTRPKSIHFRLKWQLRACYVSNRLANIGYIQVVRHCNHFCGFCSNPTTPYTHTFESMQVLVDDLAKRGYFGVILTGGEPSLHPELPRICAYAVEKGLHVRMITNGWRLSDPAFAKEMADAGLSLVHVSVYSVKPEIEERLRGTPNTLERAYAAVDNANKYGIEVNINCVINKLNADHLDLGVKHWLKNHPHIRHFVWNNLDPSMGRAEVNQAEFTPRLADFEGSLYRALSLLHRTGRTFRVEKVPLCYMTDFAWASTETRKIVKGEERIVHFLDHKQTVRQTDWEHIYGDACDQCSLRTICGGLFDRGNGYDPAELSPVFVSRDKIVQQIIDDPSDPSYPHRTIEAWSEDFERRLAELRSQPKPDRSEEPDPAMRPADAPQVGQITDQGVRLYQAKRKSEARLAGATGVTLERPAPDRDR